MKYTLFLAKYSPIINPLPLFFLQLPCRFLKGNSTQLSERKFHSVVQGMDRRRGRKDSILIVETVEKIPPSMVAWELLFGKSRNEISPSRGRKKGELRNEKISLDARNERRGRVEGSRSVKLLELPSAWKLSTPLGSERRCNRALLLSSFSTAVSRCGGKYLSSLPSPPAPTLGPFFANNALHRRRRWNLIGSSCSPTAESLGLRERRFDKGRTERAGENNWSAFV